MRCKVFIVKFQNFTDHKDNYELKVVSRKKGKCTTWLRERGFKKVQGRDYWVNEGHRLTAIIDEAEWLDDI